jgi:hypothetical protein
MATDEEERAMWQWPGFNPPGLLVGPLPYKKSYYGKDGAWVWVPDYSHPGVAERIALQVDFYEDLYGKGLLIKQGRK